MASIVLTDTPQPTGCYILTSPDQAATVTDLAAGTGTGCWTWVRDDTFPELPARGQTNLGGPRPASNQSPAPANNEPAAGPPAADQPPLEEPPDGLWPLEEPELTRTPP